MSVSTRVPMGRTHSSVTRAQRRPRAGIRHRSCRIGRLAHLGGDRLPLDCRPRRPAQRAEHPPPRPAGFPCDRTGVSSRNRLPSGSSLRDQSPVTACRHRTVVPGSLATLEPQSRQGKPWILGKWPADNGTATRVITRPGTTSHNRGRSHVSRRCAVERKRASDPDSSFLVRHPTHPAPSPRT